MFKSLIKLKTFEGVYFCGNYSVKVTSYTDTHVTYEWEGTSVVATKTKKEFMENFTNDKDQ